MAQPETTNPLVPCQVCGAMKKSLQVHIKTVHSMTVAEYKEKYGEGASLGYTIGKAQEEGKIPVRLTNEQQEKVQAAVQTAEDEKFEARVASLSRETGYDPSVEFVIRQLVTTETMIERYQKAISIISASPAKMIAQAEELGKLILSQEKLSGRHASLMSSLVLSREQRQKNRKFVQTTQSRIITNYAAERERLNADERKVFDEDDQDALRRFWKNQKELLTIIPQDVVIAEVPTVDSDDDL